MSYITSKAVFEGKQIDLGRVERSSDKKERILNENKGFNLKQARVIPDWGRKWTPKKNKPHKQPSHRYYKKMCLHKKNIHFWTLLEKILIVTKIYKKKYSLIFHSKWGKGMYEIILMMDVWKCSTIIFKINDHTSFKIPKFQGRVSHTHTVH